MDALHCPTSVTSGVNVAQVAVCVGMILYVRSSGYGREYMNCWPSVPRPGGVGVSLIDNDRGEHYGVANRR